MDSACMWLALNWEERGNLLKMEFIENGRKTEMKCTEMKKKVPLIQSPPPAHLAFRLELGNRGVLLPYVPNSDFSWGGGGNWKIF